MAAEIFHHPGYKDKETFCQDIENKLNYLVTARPTAVNMQIAAEKFIKLAKYVRDYNIYDLSYMKHRYIFIGLYSWRNI